MCAPRCMLIKQALTPCSSANSTRTIRRPHRGGLQRQCPQTMHPSSNLSHASTVMAKTPTRSQFRTAARRLQDDNNDLAYLVEAKTTTNHVVRHDSTPDLRRRGWLNPRRRVDRSLTWRAPPGCSGKAHVVMIRKTKSNQGTYSHTNPRSIDNHSSHDNNNDTMQNNERKQQT